MTERTQSGGKKKSQGIATVMAIHPLRTINVHVRFHSKPSNNYDEMLVLRELMHRQHEGQASRTHRKVQEEKNQIIC